MLCGTIGGLLVPHLTDVNPNRALTMLIFSYVMQGGLRESLVHLTSEVLASS